VVAQVRPVRHSSVLHQDRAIHLLLTDVRQRVRHHQEVVHQRDRHHRRHQVRDLRVREEDSKII